MADVEKRNSDVEHVADTKSIQEPGLSEQENAVGYKEYREAMSLEVSDKEVINLSLSAEITLLAFLLTDPVIVDAESPMEARPDHPAYVSYHTGPAVHGQNIP